MNNVAVFVNIYIAEGSYFGSGTMYTRLHSENLSGSGAGIGTDIGDFNEGTFVLEPMKSYTLLIHVGNNDGYLTEEILNASSGDNTNSDIEITGTYILFDNHPLPRMDGTIDPSQKFVFAQDGLALGGFLESQLRWYVIYGHLHVCVILYLSFCW